MSMGKTRQTQETKSTLGRSDEGKAAEEVAGWARQTGNTENGVGLGGRPQVSFRHLGFEAPGQPSSIRHSLF